jgi:hypothetical protein
VPGIESGSGNAAADAIGELKPSYSGTDSLDIDELDELEEELKTVEEGPKKGSRKDWRDENYLRVGVPHTGSTTDLSRRHLAGDWTTCCS